MQSLNQVLQHKEKPKKESTKERKQKEIYINQLSSKVLQPSTNSIETVQSVTTGINTSKNVSLSKNYKDTDVLYQELSDLVNPTFRAWYCKKFYQLGRLKVLELASIARVDGSDPRKLFSHLLRGL